MTTAVMAIAKLTWKRLWRGKSIWITGLLLLVPIGLAGMALFGIRHPPTRWLRVAEMTFRSLVLLAPVLHLAPAIGEESDGKTYTYLWSRPVPRAALVLGKMLAITPLIAVLAMVAVAVAFAIVSLGPGVTSWAWLPPALLASAAGVVAASAFGLGVGSLFPRHPMVVALGYVFFAEQVLPEVPAVSNISTLYHVQRIAAAPGSPYAGGSLGGELFALALLTALWLGVALWRVRRLEFGSAEG